MEIAGRSARIEAGDPRPPQREESVRCTSIFLETHPKKWKPVLDSLFRSTPLWPPISELRVLSERCSSWHSICMLSKNEGEVNLLLSSINTLWKLMSAGSIEGTGEANFLNDNGEGTMLESASRESKRV